MKRTANWDWETPEKRIDLAPWNESFNWVEEYHASPDGESIAAIVNTEDESFGICVNGETWSPAFEKAWNLQFCPDGRLMALVCLDGQWTVGVDQQVWDSRFDFVWSPCFSADGSVIGVAFQEGMQYGMALNDIPWEDRFANMTDMALSADGRHSAATVQTDALSEGDIFKFKEGVYTAAVDGKPWDRPFVNVWGNTFDASGETLAAEVRLDRFRYSIAVNGVPWQETYNSVWPPRFAPGSDRVSAPVLTKKGWTLAQDGKPLWSSCFVQCWHHQYSPTSDDIAAIVAPEFGKWTVARNGVVWRQRAGSMLTDLVFSPDGRRIAALAKDDDQWTVLVDDKRWKNRFDRIWPQVFSPDSRHIMAKVQKNSYYTIAIDDHCWINGCDMLWPPSFNPEGDKVLIRSVENGVYYRRVLPLADLLR